jgi:hypothetical protein
VQAALRVMPPQAAAAATVERFSMSRTLCIQQSLHVGNVSVHSVQRVLCIVRGRIIIIIIKVPN